MVQDRPRSMTVFAAGEMMRRGSRGDSDRVHHREHAPGCPSHSFVSVVRDHLPGHQGYCRGCASFPPGVKIMSTRGMAVNVQAVPALAAARCR